MRMQNAMPPPSVLFYVVSIALLLINTNADRIPGKDHVDVPFCYSGATGPDKWGSLCPEYASCSNGTSQSPIDIATNKVVLNTTLKPLLREYNPTNTTLANSGICVGLHYGQKAGELVADGKIYTLKQMHWHTPGEHRLNGVQFDAELHIVHAHEDGTRAALAILYKFGKADPILAKINRKLEELAKEKCKNHEEVHVDVGIYSLEQLKRVTRTKKYYRYHGSLTTPPCSQNVVWHILTRVRSISKEQVETLKGLLEAGSKNNARPLQPINGRVVELFKDVSHEPKHN